MCVHFAARSSHVISGLRPAFARVYPSARSDLAAETFFHTHRGSSLLAGITEDDIVTWFGRAEDAGKWACLQHPGTTAMSPLSS